LCQQACVCVKIIVYRMTQSDIMFILAQYRVSYPLYTALVIGLTRERFVALGLPS